MVAIVSFVIFAAAFGVATAVIVQMIAPQWQRIAALATGHVEPVIAPLATLVLAEQRIAVRHWATQPVPIAVSRMREAA